MHGRRRRHLRRRLWAPPHGSLAFGLDRLVMLLAGTDSIAPTAVDPAQLRELGIRVVD